MTGPRAGWREGPLAAVLAALVLAVYLPALGASFQFDDWNVVVDDARLRSFGAWWQAMPAIRPLTKLLWTAGHALGGAPWVFRAANLALHAASTLLVFLLAARLARRLRCADAAGAVRVGAVAALVFGLHPAQTEAVTYITGGSVTLMGTGVLAALWCFLRELDAGRRGRWLAPLALATLAALAARETAAVLPLALLLCWTAERAGREPVPWMTLAVPTLAVIGALAAGLALTHYDQLLATSLEVRGPLENLLVQTRAVAHLTLRLLRWDLLNADPALAPDAPFAAANLVRALLLAAIVAVAAWQWRARRWLAFSILWYLLWLAPTNSLLARLDMVNDRQLYLALVGPAFALGVATLRLRAHAPFAIALLAVLLALGTGLRNRVYADEISFWQDVIAKSPHNARAANNLGMAHALACQPIAAADAFREAMRLRPEDPTAAINLALLEQGELPGVAERCRSATSSGKS